MHNNSNDFFVKSSSAPNESPLENEVTDSANPIENEPADLNPIMGQDCVSFINTQTASDTAEKNPISKETKTDSAVNTHSPIMSSPNALNNIPERNADIEYGEDEKAEDVHKECDDICLEEELGQIKKSLVQLQSNVTRLVQDQELDHVRETLDNLQFNVAYLMQNQGIAEDMIGLRKENEAYRADSNMKLMRQYGIDAMIKMYSEICRRIFVINHGINEDTELDIPTLQWALKRMERQFKPLGIKLIKTDPGTPIDESKMEIFGDDEFEDDLVMVHTEDESLKGTIKESVVPAFVWTIPSITSEPGKEWYMQYEKVCSYK